MAGPGRGPRGAGAPDRGPWAERHRVRVYGPLTAGPVVAGVLVRRSADPQPTARLFTLILCVVLAAFIVWIWRKARRTVAPFRDDPNVLWSRLAGVDRIDLVQAKVDPAPPPAYGQRGTVVLITRSGLALRPVKDGWDWRGADLPAQLVEAVAVGKAWQGGQRWPAIRGL